MFGWKNDENTHSWVNERRKKHTFVGHYVKGHEKNTHFWLRKRRKNMFFVVFSPKNVCVSSFFHKQKCVFCGCSPPKSVLLSLFPPKMCVFRQFCARKCVCSPFSPKQCAYCRFFHQKCVCFRRCPQKNVCFLAAFSPQNVCCPSLFHQRMYVLCHLFTKNGVCIVTNVGCFTSYSPKMVGCLVASSTQSVICVARFHPWWVVWSLLPPKKWFCHALPPQKVQRFAVFHQRRRILGRAFPENVWLWGHVCTQNGVSVLFSCAKNVVFVLFSAPKHVFCCRSCVFSRFSQNLSAKTCELFVIFWPAMVRFLSLWLPKCEFLSLST